MIISEEHLNSFCEIVRQGFIYYKEMLELSPNDIRIKEQINHLNSIQDSIYKYEASLKQGVLIRSLDIPYCTDLLKDAREFCNSNLSDVAKILLMSNENHNGD